MKYDRYNRPESELGDAFEGELFDAPPKPRYVIRDMGKASDNWRPKAGEQGCSPADDSGKTKDLRCACGSGYAIGVCKCKQLATVASSNGDGQPRTVRSSDDEIETSGYVRQGSAAEVIYLYFLDRYKPKFKRGATVHCDNGEEINLKIANIPNSEVLHRLASAIDAPHKNQRHGGGVDLEALPGLFRKWVGVAWGDLLQQLPEEVQARLGDDAPAREKFHQLVREAMYSQITFGDVIGRQGVTQTERRSLVGWCVKFAKVGQWRDIRSLACWTRLTQPTPGELQLHVAIRHELFSQVHGADKWLRTMGATAFATFAKKYGIGVSSEKDRPQGRRAIVLETDFLNDLTAGISDDENLPDPDKRQPPSEGLANNSDTENAITEGPSIS